MRIATKNTKNHEDFSLCFFVSFVDENIFRSADVSIQKITHVIHA